MICKSGSHHTNRGLRDYPESMIAEQSSTRNEMATVPKVCFFGDYNPAYHRYRILKKGLQACGVESIECQINKSFGSFLKNFVFINLELTKRFARLRKDFSYIIVLGDQWSIPLAWFFSQIYRKRLIFDPIVSQYSTRVYETKTLAESSLKAKLIFLHEKLAFKLSDHILATTEESKQFYCKLFSLPQDKISVLPVGGEVENENRDRQPDINSSNSFNVVYWGNFLPQHGMEYIIQAASILDQDGVDVSFTLIGTGFHQERMKRMCEGLGLSNVKFTGYLPDAEFREEISRADVVLGFFGKSGRAFRSIGNKVFEGLSLRKPVITEASPAIQRYFSHKKELYFVEPANSEELANAILELKSDPVLRKQIAKNGYRCLKENFSEKRIGEQLMKILSAIEGTREISAQIERNR